jgi:hypothetical protein
MHLPHNLRVKARFPWLGHDRPAERGDAESTSFHASQSETTLAGSGKQKLWHPSNFLAGRRRSVTFKDKTDRDLLS